MVLVGTHLLKQLAMVIVKQVCDICVPTYKTQLNYSYSSFAVTEKAEATK